VSGYLALTHDPTRQVACRHCGAVADRPMPKGWTLSRNMPFHHACPDCFSIDNKREPRHARG
jgi:hypothetical protein